MRLIGIAVVVIVVLLLMVLARRRAAVFAPVGPIGSWKVGDVWRISQGEIDGKPVFTRFNVGVKPFISRPEFAHQLGIA